MMDSRWLAGLLEGDGHFSFRVSRESQDSRRGSPLIRLQMCDRDVVARAAVMLGSQLSGPYRNGKKRRCKTWVTAIQGVRAAKIMRLLLPHLGNRKRSVVTDALKRWAVVLHLNRERQIVKCGHTSRGVFARGMCQSCYLKWWRKRNNK